MKTLLFGLTLLSAQGPALANTKTYCGTRGGTAGNAYLDDFELAQQGGDSFLLEQTDALIGSQSGVRGERGTQNGKSYCVVAELDAQGEPKKILKAWPQK